MLRKYIGSRDQQSEKGSRCEKTRFLFVSMLDINIHNVYNNKGGSRWVKDIIIKRTSKRKHETYNSSDIGSYSRFYRKKHIQKQEGIMEIAEIRKLTGLSRTKFAEKYHIPYRTLQSWELGDRECPEYVLELLRFKVEYDVKEGMID